MKILFKISAYLTAIFYKLKYKFYLPVGVVIEKNVQIHTGATFIVNRHISPKATIQIGQSTYLGRSINLHTGSSIRIGENCVFSDYVFLSTLSHGLNCSEGPILTQQDFDKGEIEIADNCFIGFGAIILPGVKLGEWCIVGAGSVVTRSFPGFTTIAGNPAAIIKIYDKDTKCWKNA